MILITLILLIAPSDINAKPKEELVAADVCKSIDSNKYQAQCEKEIRGGRFSSLAIETCVKLFKNDDSTLKSCMGVIKDKTFTQSQIDACLLKKKHLINKCLSVSGAPFQAESALDGESTPAGQ